MAKPTELTEGQRAYEAKRAANPRWRSTCTSSTVAVTPSVS